MDASSYNWHGKQAKRLNDMQVREWLLSIMKSRSQFKAITFPAADAVMESSMARDFSDVKFKFHAVEQNPRVFSKLRKQIQVLNRKHKNLSLSAPYGCCAFKGFVNRMEAPYNEDGRYHFVYLDYMGTWSADKRSEIDLLFSKHVIRRRGFLALTIMLARGRPETLDELQDYMTSNFIVVEDMRVTGAVTQTLRLKTQGLPRLIEEMARNHGLSLVTRRVAIYPGGYSFERATPEVSLLFQML